MRSPVKVRRGLRKRILLASATLAAIVAAAFVTLLLTVHDLQTEGRLSRHSVEVIATASELEKQVLDVETGVRGYVITGDERFLEPYRYARRIYPRTATRLTTLLADEPGQQRDARRIDRGIDRYVETWAVPLVRTSRRSLPAARALVATARGKRQVDALRGRFAVFIAHERTLSMERKARFDREARYALVLGGVGLTGSLLLISVFALFLVRRVVSPLGRVAVATQRLAGGEFDHRVPVRGDDEITELGRGFNQMAESLQRSRRDLQEQNVDLERLADSLRAVLDSTVDGILLTDRAGEIQLANRPIGRFTRDLGMQNNGTVTDRLLSIADRMMDPESYVEAMERLRDTPDEASFDEFELADSGRVFQGFTAPVRAESGAFVGRIWTLRDVTAARELDRLKDDFVATVSHELRTPLTSMMGFLEMVREGEVGTLTDEQDRFLAIVYRSSERLQRLVGDLLFVARLDANGLQLRFGEARVDEVVRECVESVSALARSRGIDLRLEAGEVPPLRGDAERLGQLVTNLLSNALKFTSSGGRVTARLRVEGESAVIEVEDTGIGIPQDELSRVFGRFFRSSTATEQAIPGTGLGLVISQAIAEGHGGAITVRSEAGRGTCFRVELPLSPAHVPA